YLLERVCDTVLALLGDGRLSALPGGVEEYLARRRAATAGRPAAGRPAAGRQAEGRPSTGGPSAGGPAAGRRAPGTGTGGTGGSGPDGTGGSGGSGPAAVGPSDAARIRLARKDLTRLERQIARLEKRERQLHAALARHATDYAKVAELDAQLRAVAREREEAETAWLELSDTLH